MTSTEIELKLDAINGTVSGFIVPVLILADREPFETSMINSAMSSLCSRLIPFSLNCKRDTR